MLTFFYNLIIYPLYQIIEVVYLVVWKVFRNSGFAVIGVSVAVTFLCLPLYIIAEKWQQIERDKQKEMKSGIDRIKAVFKGDEQYMILTTFYRQNNYHPLMALRSSISLLIQIPFFMAAYKYLSNLEELRGFSFYFIKDMGAPDAMFHIGSFPINVLPIAMTLINIIAGAIYCKGLGWKEKAPIYGMALLFLAVLYTSPAGLVLYWTMNNVFSLIKNIFYKLKHPVWTLYACLCAGVLALDYYVFFHHHGFLYRRLMLIGLASIVLFAPLLLKFVKFLLNTIFKPIVENKKSCTALFFTSSITLVILLGIYLPSAVISSSSVEFSFIDNINNPLYYIYNSTTQICGFILVWFTCIYYLFGKDIKAILSVLLSIFAFSALINVFICNGEYGNLSPILSFAKPELLKANNSTNLKNLLLLIIPLIAIILIIAFDKQKFVSYSFGIISFALFAISIVNLPKISKGYREAKIAQLNQKDESQIKPIFHFSKTKQNVCVIMLDRAINAYVPEIIKENPQLNTIFDGFTYYPNTISYGNHTLIGSPPLYGGYDYTPLNINNRSDEPLVQKHNEALMIMPSLFMKEGFTATVTDPSWANYSWIPDLRIYDGTGINAVNTIRAYTDSWLKDHPESSKQGVRSTLIKRNFIWYSFLRSMPTLFRDTIYNDGFYWNTNKTFEDLQDVINNYAVLDYLPKLTAFDSNSSTYTCLVNEITHEPAFLQAPEYRPLDVVTNKGDGPYANEVHFHANTAAFLRLSDWFNYLKENGVYDNTRIIIVSDHAVGVPTDRFNGNTVLPELRECYNPVLLVKDFNSHGEIQTDMQFMTNGDVPSLAFMGIIENPINPYTGNPINMDGKKDGATILTSHFWSPDQQKKNQFRLFESDYYHVHDNIFINENWEKSSPEYNLQEAE